MSHLRQLGPFPPPYGGVAVHLVRLCEVLEVGGHHVERISTVKTASVPAITSHDILRRTPIHYHTDEGNYKWLILFSVWWQILRVPYALTFHSFRVKHAFSSRIVRFFLKRALHCAKGVVAVSVPTLHSLHEQLKTNVHVSVLNSAFPISAHEMNAPMWSTVPKAWLEAKHRVVVNAGRIVKYQQTDLYGIDVAIRAFNLLANDAHNDVQLLVITGQVVDADLLAQYYSIKAHNHLVHIIPAEESPLVPVHVAATMVLRSTRTEGGPSLTLTEALELGKVAIGSNAVARPHGTHMYDTENPVELADLIVKLTTGSHSQQTHSPLPKTTNANEAAKEMLKFYADIGFVSTTKTPAEV